MNQSKISDKKIGFYEQVCTQTLDKTLEITDERIFSENGKIYREWNPYNCKLAAAIKNGLQIMPILKNSKVLCISDKISTIIHMSDLVDENGRVFVKNFEQHYIFSIFYTSLFQNIYFFQENIVLYNLNIYDHLCVYYCNHL